MNKETGEPAFPTFEITHGQVTGSTLGLSIRDYFAAKAMQAYIWRAVVEMDMEDVVVDAYEMADAMLQERAK